MQRAENPNRTETPSASERAIAARLLKQVVVDGRTSDQALLALPATPLGRELFLGSLRNYFTLSSAINARLRRPLRRKDQDLRCLMIVGAYQLFYLRVPDHAAVHATVNGCEVLGKPWAKGLVNAVLRQVEAPNERSFELPEWMEHRLREDYPTHAEAIMDACLERAPMVLRINQQRDDPLHYRDQLNAQGLPHERLWFEESVVLERPVPAQSLPGFHKGTVAIQDGGAQFAAHLLNPRPGARVLDACAAPGGKLFHLLELQPSIELTAIEQSPSRVRFLLEEGARLGHRQPNVLEADATNCSWWDGAVFDHILLDAPCSGSGTLRRHPDIKLNRTEQDLARLLDLQQRLLSNLWQTLAPGGTLLYCTCSLFDAENDGIIGDFLNRAQPKANPVPLLLPTGVRKRHGWQLLPTDKNSDGFYYALLEKPFLDTPLSEIPEQAPA